MPATFPARFEVLIQLNTTRHFGRSVLAGVARHFRDGGRWAVYGEPSPAALPLAGVSRWRGDGALLDLTDEREAEAAEQLQCPVVCVAGRVDDPPFPVVSVDQRAVGRAGAEHLIRKGYRQLGFYGGEDRRQHRLRMEGFCEAVEAAGAVCDEHAVYRPPPGLDGAATHRDVRGWLESLPRPVAVMCGNDELAVAILAACRDAGLSVPDDVAVLGVGDDPLICEFATPSLSSVGISAELIGYEAAVLLRSLIDGGDPPGRPTLLPTSGVSERESTASSAVTDPHVAAALRFIRENVQRQLNVADVVEALAVPRRTLERKFRDALDRSPLDEIQLQRLERAKQLLAGTDLEMTSVAHGAGYPDVKRFNPTFKAKVGVTPTEYRKQFRAT